MAETATTPSQQDIIDAIKAADEKLDIANAKDQEQADAQDNLAVIQASAQKSVNDAATALKAAAQAQLTAHQDVSDSASKLLDLVKAHFKVS
jgi:hypothetical protein